MHIIIVVVLASFKAGITSSGSIIISSLLVIASSYGLCLSHFLACWFVSLVFSSFSTLSRPYLSPFSFPLCLFFNLSFCQMIQLEGWVSVGAPYTLYHTVLSFILCFSLLPSVSLTSTWHCRSSLVFHFLYLMQILHSLSHHFYQRRAQPDAKNKPCSTVQTLLKSSLLLLLSHYVACLSLSLSLSLFVHIRSKHGSPSSFFSSSIVCAASCSFEPLPCHPSVSLTLHSFTVWFSSASLARTFFSRIRLYSRSSRPYHIILTSRPFLQLTPSPIPQAITGGFFMNAWTRRVSLCIFTLPVRYSTDSQSGSLSTESCSQRRYVFVGWLAIVG